MFHGFTPAQASLLHNIVEGRGVYCVFHGLDANALPVIQFKDARRVTDRFAIPRSTGRRGAVEPQLPIRWFTDEEIDNMDWTSYQLITSCYKDFPHDQGPGV